MGPFAEITSLLNSIRFIPYENLSKIVAFSEDSDWKKVLDTPDKLHKKSVSMGAGGTCFSLTYFLHTQLREKGYASEFLMAHKYHFKNIHCGLYLEAEGQSYLLDPGYMIYDPMPIPSNSLKLHFPFIPNEVCLEDMGTENVIRLYTGKKEDLKFRFDFQKDPVDLDQYFSYWKDSFYLDMMEYPVLNKVIGNTQHYIQKKNYMIRTEQGSQLVRLDSESFAQTVHGVFGLSEQLIDRSMQVLIQKGRGLF